ncbi:hypothetical protein AVEN_237222-1 [Araneus ventricosus]|uniref:Uncharacterized protein n=1 Tax=Araneus ventricosus TaxID=182803 RepID=A0A4Y2M906_ARAVE|nr:hypothetical protein AVEN_237222-1 [Araneus ventricosus]
MTQMLVEARLGDKLPSYILWNELVWPVGSKGTLVTRAVYKNEDIIPAVICHFNESSKHLNKNTKSLQCFPILHESEVEHNTCHHLSAKSFSFGNCDEADLEWYSDFKSEHLPEETRGKLINFLERNKQVFAASVEDLPGCDTVTERIELSDSIPVKQRAYRVPYNLTSEMDKHLDKQTMDKQMDKLSQRLD